MIYTSASSQPWLMLAHDDYAVFGAAAQSTATAAANGQVQLWNPSASGILIRVIRCAAWISTAGEVQIGWYNTELSAAGDTPLSLHDSGQGSPQGLVRKATHNGTQATRFGRVYCGTGGNVELCQHQGEWCLDPGYGLTIETITQNIELTVFWEWVEGT